MHSIFYEKYIHNNHEFQNLWGKHIKLRICLPMSNILCIIYKKKNQVFKFYTGL